MRAPFPACLRPVALLLLLAASPLTGCYGTTGYVEADDGVYDVDGAGVDPTAAFVATNPPYYYDGRPVYYYGNRWRYRQGGRWAHYRTEPAPLHAARMHVGGSRGGFRSGGARGGRWR